MILSGKIEEVNAECVKMLTANIADILTEDKVKLKMNVFKRSHIRYALEGSLKISGGLIVYGRMIDLGDDEENPEYTQLKIDVIEEILDTLEERGLVINDMVIS